MDQRVCKKIFQVYPAFFFTGMAWLCARGLFARPNDEADKKIRQAYLNLPLYFEKNEGQSRSGRPGQTDPSVRFSARGAGYSLFLTPAEAVLMLRSPLN